MVKAENTKSLTSLKDLNDKATETSNYFWHTETDTGAGKGAHITEIPKEDFIEAVTEDPTSGGGNTLITSAGMAIRDGLTEVATFGSNKIELGKNNDEARIEIAQGNGIIRGEKLYEPDYDEYYGASLHIATDTNYGSGSGISFDEIDENTQTAQEWGYRSGVSVYGKRIAFRGVMPTASFDPEHDGYLFDRLEDWVTYSGLIGAWQARFWHKGKLELWRKVTGNSTCSTSSNGIYRSGVKSLGFPILTDGSPLIRGLDIIQVTGGFDGLANTGVAAAALNLINDPPTLDFYLTSHSSITSSRGYTAYIYLVNYNWWNQ